VDGEEFSANGGVTRGEIVGYHGELVRDDVHQGVGGDVDDDVVDDGVFVGARMLSAARRSETDQNWKA
jgi:hypothetical protein